MKLVRMDYGRTGLDVHLPSGTVVIEPVAASPLADEAAALRAALRDPIGSPALRELVRPGARVVVVHSDITRPMPNDRVLPVLLAELEEAGAARGDITLLNALGTHRPQTQSEMEELLGPEIAQRYRCVQHDAWDAAQLVSIGDQGGVSSSGGHRVGAAGNDRLGGGDGDSDQSVSDQGGGDHGGYDRGGAGSRRHDPRSDILLHRAYVEADLRILTGFIEPHFFAGFSGGPKAILPGVAGIDCIMANHGPDRLGHPSATWGVTHDNPVWDEMLDAAVRAGPCFNLNVTLDADRRLTGVFAGALEASHAAGCAACRESSMIAVPQAFDIVVTSNAGHPLDLNLYQSVKGMSAARQIVKPGGAIVVVAACADGLPEHGEYANLLREADSAEALLARVTAPGFSCHDQWQAHSQAEIQLHAEVHVYSEGLTDGQIRDALFEPSRDVGDTVSALVDRLGPGATVCALPGGPLTVPYIAKTE